MLSSERLAEDWSSPKLRFEIRFMVLVADMLFREEGAHRMRILRLLDGPDLYASGRAADLSVLELPGVRKAELGDWRILPAFISDRMNLLFPSSDGRIVTSTYDGEKITLRLSAAGFHPASCVLSEWFAWGATGRILTPRKIKI